VKEYVEEESWVTF